MGTFLKGMKMQVWEAGRVADREEGRPKEGPDILEVCAAPMRPVRVDSVGSEPKGGRHGDQPRKLLHGDGRGFEDDKEITEQCNQEIQESEEIKGGTTREGMHRPCWKCRTRKLCRGVGKWLLELCLHFKGQRNYKEAARRERR